jgi:hypothetical protein
MIGIFGDSYAYEHDTSIAYGWPTHLSKIYNEEFENHSLYGSSLAYSHKQFKKQDVKKYSKIVFVCTEPGRQMLVDDEDNYQLHFSGTAERSINLNKQDQYQKFKQKDRNTNVKILYEMENVLATYPNTWDFVKDLLIDHVNNSHSNVLILSIRDLFLLTQLDIHHGWKPYPPRNNCVESLELGRECHISQKQNIELAGYIKRYFEDGFDIHSTFKNVEKYYTKAKTFEEAGFRNI